MGSYQEWLAASVDELVALVNVKNGEKSEVTVSSSSSTPASSTQGTFYIVCKSLIMNVIIWVYAILFKHKPP